MESLKVIFFFVFSSLLHTTKGSGVKLDWAPLVPGITRFLAVFFVISVAVSLNL